MDQRLEKALAFSNYRITIENRRKALKRRFESMIVVHYGGGMFKADQPTINFVSTLLQRGHKDSILIDEKGNPVEITDLVELLDTLFDAYFKATNEYSSETKTLAKARDIKKAMNW